MRPQAAGSVIFHKNAPTLQKISVSILTFDGFSGKIKGEEFERRIPL
jgi:hypothetical protein